MGMNVMFKNDEEKVLVENYSRYRFEDSCETYNLISAYEMSIFDEKQVKSYLKDYYPYEEVYIGFTKSEFRDLIKRLMAIEDKTLIYINSVSTRIQVGYLAEHYNSSSFTNTTFEGYTIEFIPVNIFDFINKYVEDMGKEPPFLLQVSPAMKLKNIFLRGIDLGAMDIQIVSKRNKGVVRYKVKSKWYKSKIFVTGTDISDIRDILSKNSPIADNLNKSQYYEYEINDDWKGRVNATLSYQGIMIVIRLLKNGLEEINFNDLNFSDTMIDIFNSWVMNNEPGLRLFVGATGTGKSTTALSLLSKYLEIDDNYNIISLEFPVEREIDGVNQISVTSSEGFADSAAALIRQNPDIVYIAEINEFSYDSVMKTSNTAKTVISSIHANDSVSSLLRIQDITGMGLNRIILTMHSILCQELVEIDGVFRPVLKAVKFTEDLKVKCLDANVSDIYKYIKEVEIHDEYYKAQK